MNVVTSICPPMNGHVPVLSQHGPGNQEQQDEQREALHDGARPGEMTRTYTPSSR